MEEDKEVIVEAPVYSGASLEPENIPNVLDASLNPDNYNTCECSCSGGAAPCENDCDCSCGVCIGCIACGNGSNGNANGPDDQPGTETPDIKNGKTMMEKLEEIPVKTQVESSLAAFQILETFEETFALELPVLEAYSGNSWKIAVITEGWSKNNKYYPKNVLERDKQVFEGVPIAIWGYTPETKNLNHLPNRVRNSVPEGLAKNTVGWVEDVRSEMNDRGKTELVGTFHCIDEALAKKLSNAWAKGKKDLLGFSIDATGEIIPGLAEGRKGPVVNRIIKGNEVTLVHNPAAGGKFLRLIASLDELDESDEPETEELVIDEVIETLAKTEVEDTNNIETEVIIDTNQNNGSVIKMDENKDTLFEDFAKLREEMNAQKLVLEEAQKVAKIEKCKSMLSSKLATAGLGSKGTQMVAKRFAVDRIFEEVEVDNEIADVRELLAESNGGTAQISQKVEVGADIYDRLQAGMDLVFGYTPKDDKNLTESQRDLYSEVATDGVSINAIYKLWADDPKFNWNPGPNALTESTTGDFTTSLNNSMGKALFQKYNELPKLWEPFVTLNTNVMDFKDQTRIITGGFGGLYPVSESDSSDTYTDMNIFTEDSIQYHVNSFGGTTKITRKMIINDDLGILSDIPRKMARAANNDLHKFVFGMMIGNKAGAGINTDDAYDAIDIYHANHFNLGSTALSHTSLSAAINALSTQYEYGMRTAITDNPLSSGATTVNVTSTAGWAAGQAFRTEAEVIIVGTVASATQFTGCTRGAYGTTAASHIATTKIYQLAAPLNLLRYYLVYPLELRDSVNRIFRSPGVSGTNLNDNNQFNAMLADGTLVLKPTPTQYLGGDQNNWYLLAFPSDISILEMAFLMNRQVPESFVQDTPASPLPFFRDNTVYKIRHEYGGTFLDWRGAYAAIVA